MKYSTILFTSMLLLSSIGVSQTKLEREHRIRKSQFPESAIVFMESKIDHAKRIRYYREIDTNTIHYTSKFKKDRLYYGMQFSEKGYLDAVEIMVKAIDIPKDSWESILDFMTGHFSKYKVKKIQQQYRVTKEKPETVTLKNAFQNLLIPELTYSILTKGKIEGKCEDYEILFDSDGNLIGFEKSLPPNYDHILY